MVNFLKSMYGIPSMYDMDVYVRQRFMYGMTSTYLKVNMGNFLKFMYGIPSMYDMDVYVRQRFMYGMMYIHT